MQFAICDSPTAAPNFGVTSMTWLPWVLLGLATWLLLSMPLAILLGSAIRKAEYGELGQGVTPCTGRISTIATDCSTPHGSYHPSRVGDRDRAPPPAADAPAAGTSISDMRRFR
jgi:hypothetical protein